MYLREVIDIKEYNSSLIKLSVKRGEINFKPGQHFSLSIDQIFINREYSAYSGPKDELLDFLIRIVDQGSLSTKIKNLKIGEKLYLHGPFGKFLDDINFDLYKNIICISTGSGIAPYRSLISNNRSNKIRIIQGIRTSDDIIEEDEFENIDINYCITRNRKMGNSYKGRVTEFILENKNEFIDDKNIFFICGNKEMIADVYKILIDNYGIPSTRIIAESFF